MLSWQFLLRWSCIGLLLRFLLMPFTLHALDLFYIHYLPYLILHPPHADLYGWFRQQFPYYDFFPSYPLGSVYLSIFFQKILEPFFHQFSHLMNAFQEVAFQQGGSSVHFATVLQNPYFFRTLFLLKFGYLFFDFATAFLLLDFCTDEKHKRWLYCFWMLNPISLHTAYGIGQIDGIITFFLVFSCWLIRKKRVKWGMFFLGIGGLVKLAPFYLVPPFAIVLEKKWHKRFLLMTSAALPLVAVSFCSKNPAGVTKSFMGWATLYWEVIHSITPFVLLGVGYFILFLLFAKRGRIKPEQVSLFFCVFLLLLWATISQRPRHFLWVVPFLILEVFKKSYLLGWVVCLFLAMWEIHAAGINYQLGIFAPIEPTFFTSLPIWDSFMVLVCDVWWIHRLCLAWVLLSSTVILILLMKQSVKEIKMLNKISSVLVLFGTLFPILGFLYVTQAKKADIPRLEKQTIVRDIGIGKAPPTWSIPLDGQTKISQEFLCNFDGLSRIGIYIKLAPNRKPDQIRFLLQSDPSKETLRTEILSGDAIRPNPHDFYVIPPDASGSNWFRLYFDFEPLAESAGKKYRITLENVTLDPAKKIQVGIVPGVYYTGMKEGSYFEGNEKVPGKSLAFVTYCRYLQNPKGIPKKLIAKLKQDPAFYRFYKFSLAFLLVGMVVSFYQSRLLRWNIEH